MSATDGRWRFDLDSVFPPHVAQITGTRLSGGFAQNCYMSLWTLLVTLVVVCLVSLVTRPKPESEIAPHLLVLSSAAVAAEGPLWSRPLTMASALLVVLAFINVYFS